MRLKRLKQKLNDLQATITVAAVLLMMPPIILIFERAGLINQIPVVVAFIFGAWLLLILGTWWLVRLSGDGSDEPKPPAPPRKVSD